VSEDAYGVLFLCTGNSARSILAEALMNHWGQGRFIAYSAGSRPTGRVNPYALALLERMRMPLESPRSKSWDEFAGPDSPRMDFIITVCDSAAGEICPIWPGRPMTAHWGVEDPAAVMGSEFEKTQAFRKAFNELEHRVRIFASLPVASLDRLRLQRELDAIGVSRPGDSA
jgi:arsenate reductase